MADFEPFTKSGKNVGDWQEERIEERIQAADAGRFATADAVKAIIQKYVRDGAVDVPARLKNGP